MSGTIADWERERFHRATADAITALPETLEPPVSAPAPAEGGPLVLMERSCGGWRTELRLCADGRVAITAQQGEDGRLRATFVPGDKALDAFNHPYCYLPI